MVKVDYLVVGQGIAGTVITEHLISAGLRVHVIDDPHYSNSSKVAGGLYNPITGRKMVKTWNCDVLFDYLIPFYRKLELKLETNFLFEIPIYRPFYSNEEYNEWMGKSAEPAYGRYIKSIHGQHVFANHLHDSFGGIILNESGYLDTRKMVRAYRNYLAQHGMISDLPFGYEKLELSDDGVVYGDFHASKIIFSEGRFQDENPWFDWLPQKPVKGELIWIKSQEEIEHIYNRGVFLIPLSDGICKVGATYDHEKLDELTTEKAQSQLINRLRKLISFEFQVVDQKAGVRPATIDRKPFIGKHPQFKNVVIFNGLGAKGVSLAPYYANQLLLHLEKNMDLDDEVNIARFFSLFSKPL